MEKATDVFVIGGGPAGLAAAIAARQRGLSVVVADGSRPPIDKPCGEGLMPDGRAALAELGISVPEELSRPFRGISFVSGGLRAEANFPNGCGIGVRRKVLHRLMVERAEAAGITLLWSTPVKGLYSDGVLLGKELVRSRWVVGADGGHSLVRLALTATAATARALPFAATTASLPGPIAWNCIGARSARSM